MRLFLFLGYTQVLGAHSFKDKLFRTSCIQDFLLALGVITIPKSDHVHLPLEDLTQMYKIDQKMYSDK